MTQRFQVYECEVCGNIVESMIAGNGTLTCCEQSMKLLEENSVDAAKEKHVPVLERISGGYKVAVGSVAHPMEEKHHIQWIELIADGNVYRQYLRPGQKAEATFQLEATDVRAREYCNLHGHWRN